MKNIWKPRCKTPPAIPYIGNTRRREKGVKKGRLYC